MTSEALGPTRAEQRSLGCRSSRTRRDFLAGLSAAGAAGVLGAPARSLADEGPPETTTIRLHHDPCICIAPWYIAEDLLRAEGFTDIRYVPVRSGPPEDS